MDLFPGGELGVDAGTSKKVDCHFRLWESFVPQVHWEVIIGAGPGGCNKVVLGGPDGALCCIGSMVVDWDQLVFNAFLDKVVFQKLRAFIVKAVELGLAASFGEGGVDVGYSCCESLCFSVAQWAHEDAVAVIVIGYQDVVVAVAGQLGQSSSLVSVDAFLGFSDS
jgi:hypothetical protein